MEKIIKEIRNSLNLSQVEFAQALNVTFQTVNRWENGHAFPNRLAQSQIYDLCKEKEIDVYNLTLKRIKDIESTIDLDKGRILLYHGSKSGIEGAIEPKSRSLCDFGKGFYMGTNVSQTLTLICDFEKSKLYILSISLDNLEKLEVPDNIDWAMLVAFYRGRTEEIKGTSFYNKYRDMAKAKDIVIGSIADDRIFYVVDNFFLGNISDKALINSLSALDLGKQYVAISKKACDEIRIEKVLELSYIERLALKDVAEANRQKGIKLAKDIAKDYRREGLFFDEIIDGVNK